MKPCLTFHRLKGSFWVNFSFKKTKKKKLFVTVSGSSKTKLHIKHSPINSHVFTEALSVLPAGEVEVAVQVEVVWRELGDSHDGLFTVLFDGVRPRLLLGLPHQTFLQTGDHFALRVDVLHREERRGEERSNQASGVIQLCGDKESFSDNNWKF